MTVIFPKLGEWQSLPIIHHNMHGRLLRKLSVPGCKNCGKLVG